MGPMPSLTLPAPRTPDPMDAPPARWGVMAPGSIATAFAGSLQGSTQQAIAAVGSRSLHRARAFADRFGAEAAYGSYEELVADPSVDVIYVASPHSEHLAGALLAIEAGKPVLVEKAFTRNASEARQLLDAARDRGLFAMEAMWSRFLPHIDVVRQAVESGLLGEVHTVMADHGQPLYPDGPARLAEPGLAGGALLDLGVYPVSFASMVLGGFASIAAAGTLTGEGVDAQDTIAVTSQSGAHGVISTSMLTKTPTTAAICGNTARLEIDGDFYGPNPVRLVGPQGDVLDTFAPEEGQMHGGLRYEAVEVARCLADGLAESPLMPHAETLRVMEAMDEIRRQVGVRYPGE
jgi:predicted dehydrogenase